MRVRLFPAPGSAVPVGAAGGCRRCLTELICVDTREEDLTHPEDIAHFAKHDAMEEAADRQEQLDRMPIVEQNIPQKFRRVP